MDTDGVVTMEEALITMVSMMVYTMVAITAPTMTQVQEDRL